MNVTSDVLTAYIDGPQMHMASVNTIDPNDQIDRMEYQTSSDGITWTMLAYAEGLVASPPPHNSNGRLSPPSLRISLSAPAGTMFRAVVMHSLGKTLTAYAEVI